MRRLLALLLPLLLFACTGEETSQQQQKSLTLAGITDGLVILSKYDGQKKEQLYEGKFTEFPLEKVTAKAAKIDYPLILVEIKEATLRTIAGKQEINFPQETTWSTILEQIPADGLATIQINPYTTIATTYVQYLYQQRGLEIKSAVRQAFDQVAKSIAIEELNFTSLVDPYIKGLAPSAPLNYTLALLGLELSGKRLTASCKSDDPWQLYFELVNHLISDAKDGKIDAIVDNKPFELCGLKISGENLKNLILDSTLDHLLENEAIRKAGSIFQGEIYFQTVQQGTKNFPLEKQPSLDLSTKTPEIIINEPAKWKNLTSLSDLSVTAKDTTSELLYLGTSLADSIIPCQTIDNNDSKLHLQGTIDPLHYAPGEYYLQTAARNSLGNIKLIEQPLFLNTPDRSVNIKIKPAAEEIDKADRVFAEKYDPQLKRHIVKGNFELRGNLLLAGAKERLYFTSNESKIADDLQPRKDKDYSNESYRVTVWARDKEVNMTKSTDTEESSIFQAMANNFGEVYELENFKILMVKYPPQIDLTFLPSRQCTWQENGTIFVCQRASKIFFTIEATSHFGISSVSSKLIYRHKDGTEQKKNCHHNGNNQFSCDLNADYFSDGPLNIEVTVNEASNDSVTSKYQFYLDNHSFEITRNADNAGIHSPKGYPNSFSGPVLDLNGDGFADIVTYGRDEKDNAVILIHWNRGATAPGQSDGHPTVLDSPDSLGTPTKNLSNVIACDVNGDGQKDLIAGCPDYSSVTYRNAGKVVAYLSPFSRDGASHRQIVYEPTYTIGPNPDLKDDFQFGSFISCAKSFRHANVEDIIVNYKTFERHMYYEPLNEKRVILFGDSQRWGKTKPEFCFLANNQQLDFFRTKYVGDIDRSDQYGDYVTILPDGSAKVIFGPWSATPSEDFFQPRKMICGNYNLGPVVGGPTRVRDIHPLGDINKDGFADFALAHVQPHPSYQGGQLNIFLGSAAWRNSGMVPAPFVELYITEGRPGHSNLFASGKVVAGDFNNDGLTDIAVGNKYYEELRGLISIFYGKINDNGYYTIETNQNFVQIREEPRGGTHHLFGFRMAVADLDHDGYDDLVSHSQYATSFCDGSSCRYGIPWAFLKKKEW